MKENLEQAVAELLEKTLDGVDKSVDFLSGEIPLYIHELLMWHGILSFVFFAIGIALLAFYWKLFKAIQSKIKTVKCSADRGALYFVFGLGNVLYGTSAILVTLSNLTWLQIWLAPRVFLVEYAARLAG